MLKVKVKVLLCNRAYQVLNMLNVKVNVLLCNQAYQMINMLKVEVKVKVLLCNQAYRVLNMLKVKVKVKVLLCNQAYQVLLKCTNPVGADAVVDVAVIPDEGEHSCTAQLGFGCPLCIVTWVVKKTFQLCDSKIIFQSAL